jgi:hypothetical protein
MRVHEGGGLYGFCPGKATTDQDALLVYRALLVCDRTGANWQEGGIADQPTWWIELVSDFLPRIDDMRFYSRARAILGDSSKGGSNGNQQKLSGNSNQRIRK